MVPLSERYKSRVRLVSDVEAFVKQVAKRKHRCSAAITVSLLEARASALDRKGCMTNQRCLMAGPGSGAH